jgi:hypothetical protein
MEAAVLSLTLFPLSPLFLQAGCRPLGTKLSITAVMLHTLLTWKEKSGDHGAAATIQDWRN